MALFLSLSFIGCKKGEVSGKILNKAEIPIYIQQDTETVKELAPGECVGLTQEQIDKLRVKESDTRNLGGLFALDDVICGEADAKCEVTKTSIIVENVDGDHELVGNKDKAEEVRVKEDGEDEVEYGFSNCEALEVEEDENASENGDGENEEDNTK